MAKEISNREFERIKKKIEKIFREKDKEVFLFIDLNPDDPFMHTYLSKLDVRFYLKFLKKVESLVPVSSI